MLPHAPTRLPEAHRHPDSSAAITAARRSAWLPAFVAACFVLLGGSLASVASAVIVEITPEDFDLTVLDIYIAPDQEHVAFVARGVSDDGPGSTVWWTRIDGTMEPRLLSGVLEDVQHVAISPDSQRVAFNAFDGGILEIWTVLVDTPAPIKISTPSVNGRADTMVFSDDGSRVLYSEGENGTIRRLWTAPADGSSLATPISDADDNLAGFGIAVGGRVIYRVYQSDVERSELFAAPVDGSSPPVLLSLFPGDPVANDEELMAIEEWALSPDRTKVVYLADRRWPDEPDNSAADGELYVVPSSGASGDEQRLDLDEPFAQKTYSDITHEFTITQDGQRVVFRYSRGAELEEDQISNRLFAVPIDGSTPPAPLADESDAVTDFKASEDHAIYRGGGTNSLRSVSFLGTTVTLDGDPVSSRDIGTGYLSTPDGLRVVYPVGPERALWSRLLDGSSSPTELTPFLGFNGAVLLGWGVTPGSSHVLFRSDFELDGLYELYATPTGGGTAVKLNDPLLTGRRLGGFVATTDDRCVVFASASTSDSPRRLYGADLEGQCAFDPEIFSDGFESGDTSSWSAAVD